jgi:hypothetical protein
VQIERRARGGDLANAQRRQGAWPRCELGASTAAAAKPACRDRGDSRPGWHRRRARTRRSHGAPGVGCAPGAAGRSGSSQPGPRAAGPGFLRVSHRRWSAPGAGFWPRSRSDTTPHRAHSAEDGEVDARRHREHRGRGAGRLQGRGLSDATPVLRKTSRRIVLQSVWFSTCRWAVVKPRHELTSQRWTPVLTSSARAGIGMVISAYASVRAYLQLVRPPRRRR